MSYSINVIGKHCLECFGGIYVILSEPGCPWRNVISPSHWQDELGRFKVWAGNIGALQPKEMESSLEYRLRDASRTRKHVLDFLQDLYESLKEGNLNFSFEWQRLTLLKVKSIVSGEREQFGDLTVLYPPEDDDLFDTSASDSNSEPNSELQELFAAAADSITSLFELSMVLRNATPHDRYAKAASIGTYDSHFDIDYIWHKFGPYARPSLTNSEWLVERLGRANTRRREYLKYCEKHRDRLAYIPLGPKLDETRKLSEIRQNLVPVNADATRSVFSSPSILAPTTASTYIEKLTAPIAEEFETQSMTSYATSVENTEEGNLNIPPRPRESESEKPFECPYCYTIQVAKNDRAWR
jgi:hypothetical protein